MSTHIPRQDRVSSLWRATFPGMAEPHSRALQRRIDALGEEQVIEAIEITRSRMRADAPGDELQRYFFGVLRRMGQGSFVGKWVHAAGRQGHVLSSPRQDTFLVEWVGGGQELVTLDGMIGWTFYDSRQAIESSTARW